MKKLSFKIKSVPLITFDADLDWKRIFFFFIALMVLGLIWSGYVFWTVESEQAYNSPDAVASQSASIPVPNEKDIENVRTLEDAKASRFKDAMNTAPNVVDPSL